MRVITGTARGRKLLEPAGMDIRPTTDKVKEAFNNVANVAENRFLKSMKSLNAKRSILGLAIATTIVSAHNGTIKASHNTPKGTIFTIKLLR